MPLELKDKLYTSTQVADILGVSLRTLYRYMEDDKIKSMRTASGRHRFTKEQILEFLNAGRASSFREEPAQNVYGQEGQSIVSQQTSRAGVNVEQDAQMSQAAVRTMPRQSFSPAESGAQEQLTQTQASEDVVAQKEVSDTQGSALNQAQGISSEVSRSSAQLETEPATPYDQTQATTKTSVSSSQGPQVAASDFTETTRSETETKQSTKTSFSEEPVDLGVGISVRYYKSEYTDLIELARKIKEVASAKDLEYAFTVYAGLSLHFLIKPFTILHIYANPEDMQIWKDGLRLTPVQNREDANVGVIINTDIVFVPTREIGGFKVVDDKVLLKDLSASGDEELVKKFREHLTKA